MGEPVFSVGLHGLPQACDCYPKSSCGTRMAVHWASYTLLGRVYAVSALGHTGTQTHTMG